MNFLVGVTTNLSKETRYVGELYTGRRNSRGTKGEGRGLFCHSCLNKLFVTVTVTVWLKLMIRL
jgi:hypothetical protein